MVIEASVLKLKTLKGYADWHLLLFLLLFLDVKIAVKILAIILIYLLRFNFRFGFDGKNSRLPLFYPLIIITALIGFAFSKNYTNTNYLIVLTTGIGFWILCILAMHQIKLSVERNEAAVIHRTIFVFFVINALISILNLVLIIWKTGVFNPYLYQGQYQKYFISTGDYIKGVTFDTSTTNAILNAFGVIYFLTKKNALMVLLCMAILLLTGSNFTNVILLSILGAIFIFNSSRNQKSILIICLLFLVVFMGRVSPQNNKYVVNTVKTIFYPTNLTYPVIKNNLPITLRPDSTLTFEERRQKFAILYLDSIRRRKAKRKPRRPILTVPKGVLVSNVGKIVIPEADINSAEYQHLATTPPEQKQLAGFVNTHKAILPISGQGVHIPNVPGKLISIFQTLIFFKNNPAKIITGNGIGNFSSKLAFKTTGLGFTGGYPAKYVHINHDFLINHFDLYLNFFSKNAGLQSLTNSPFSVYDQLLGEYGIIGFLAFFIFYLGFFLKDRKALTYGLPILILTTAVLFIYYWFEQLSVIVFFELIILLNIKESSTKNNIRYGH